MIVNTDLSRENIRRQALNLKEAIKIIREEGAIVTQHVTKPIIYIQWPKDDEKYEYSPSELISFTRNLRETHTKDLKKYSRKRNRARTREEIHRAIVEDKEISAGSKDPIHKEDPWGWD